MTPEERFQYCMDVIFQHEGGLVDDPHDPGGITKYGISLRFLLDNDITFDGRTKPTQETVIDLMPDEAEDLYREWWWDKYHYDRFNAIQVVSKVFDMAVNFGPRSGHKVLQRACNKLLAADLKNPIAVDGILGPITLSFSNELPPDSLREAMRYMAKLRYLEIIALNPKLERFRKGWLTRAAW